MMFGKQGEINRLREEVQCLEESHNEWRKREKRLTRLGLIPGLFLYDEDYPANINWHFIRQADEDLTAYRQVQRGKQVKKELD